MERVLAVLATLAAGALVAAQPPANSELAKQVGSLGSAFISISISLAVIGVLLVASGEVGELGGLSHFRAEYALGGLAGAAIVAVSLVTVRTLGAGGVVAATVCTQLIVSLILDRLGVLGLSPTALTPVRVAGAVLLIGGTILLTSGD
jgi:bacterial/archaeal transporter family-2 protein